MKKKTLNIRHENPFVMIDYMALMSETLTAYEIAVYCILCAYASSTDQSCYPSYQTIARKSGCSRRTAIRVIAHLEELGLVKKQEQFNAVGDNTSNLYIVKPMNNKQSTPPPDAELALPNAPNSPPNAEETPKPDSLNQIQMDQNHSSIYSPERWKEQIEYEYFEEEMPDKLPLIDSLLGIILELQTDNLPQNFRLLEQIDSCVVMEFFEELHGKSFAGVRNFTAYLKKVFLEFLKKRNAEVIAIS